jgi:hypothetical protein
VRLVAPATSNRRGGGRERQRTVAATCGLAQIDGLVSSVMSAWAAWPR